MSAAENRFKVRCRNFKKYCISNFKKFLRETSLNGLKYVGDESLTIWERLFFLIAFVTAVAVAIQLSVEIYHKWENTPVIISLSSKAASILKSPFAAVTICNMNQALYSRVYHYGPLSLEDAYLKKICSLNQNYSKYDNLKPRNIEDTFENFVFKHAQSCSHMIGVCMFGSKSINCTDLFREVMMDEGLCCVFNTLHPYYLYKGNYNFIRGYTTSSGVIPVDWSPENGYAKDLPEEFYPRPAKGPGITIGLTLILNANMDDYYCSSTNGPGFKVSLHNPIDTPHVAETGIPVMVGHESRFRIDTSSSQALSSIRSIRPKQRQCYFNNEQHLFYYKYYSRRNCEMECTSKLMLRYCKCIPYYLPLIYQNSSVCQVKDFNCVVSTERSPEDPNRQLCLKECLPGCFDLVFNPKVFTVPFGRGSVRLRHPYLRNLTKEYVHNNMAMVHFYYKESLYRSNVRTPYTGFTEYLSLTGGIMSFLMGFSVVSIAEMSYYAILRPIFEYCHKVRSRRRVASDSEFSADEGFVDRGNHSLFAIEAAKVAGSNQPRLATQKFRSRRPPIYNRAVAKF